MSEQEPEYRPRRAYASDPQEGASGASAPGAPPPVARPPGRTRQALLVAAVAAVVALGLALGYALLGGGTTGTSSPRPATSEDPATAASASGAARKQARSGESGPLLTDASMLTAAGARRVDPDQRWRVALTQRGVSESSPQPACLGPDQVAGQPDPQQTVLRLVSSGRRAPSVLHQASAYASPEEAAQAYALTARALGGCTMPGGSMVSGAEITGLGDSAVGLVVRVFDGKVTQFRTVVASRTGRVLDVVDVASPTDPVDVEPLAAATATVVAAQCRAAGGRCPRKVTVDTGPPPRGGDHPGFLAAGDLPVVGPRASAWVGDRPGAPKATFTGSQCESVNWAKVKAESRAQRTFVQAAGSTFGLDQIVVRLGSPAAAANLVRKVRADLASCEDRLLTASVAGLVDLKGTGTDGTRISGWATSVRQQARPGRTRYRVAMVSAGEKAVFCFLNPTDDLDLTTAQWRAVAVRAGERATQVD